MSSAAHARALAPPKAADAKCAVLDKAQVKCSKLDETKLTSEQLRDRRPIFMHTKGPHDQVPVDYFGRLLLSSFDAQSSFR